MKLYVCEDNLECDILECIRDNPDIFTVLASFSQIAFWSFPIEKNASRNYRISAD